MADMGKRYFTPSGAEMIVTKGGPGALSDGETALKIKDATASYASAATPADAMKLELGKRYESEDGAVAVLVTKAGPCDLRYDGKPMVLQGQRRVPSAD